MTASGIGNAVSAKISSTPENETKSNQSLSDDDLSWSSKDYLDAQPLLNNEGHWVRKDPSSKRWYIWVGFIALLGGIIGSVFLNALFWHYFRERPYQRPFKPTDAPKLSCGNSVAEAKSLGCKLDPMVYSFTPPECYNETHALSFFYSDDWPFWSDTNRTNPIPPEDILEAKHEGFYSTWAYHGAHCQYLLTRNMQVLPHHGPLNEYMLDEPHNEHCFKEVRHPSNLRKYVRVGIHYSDCYLTA